MNRTSSVVEFDYNGEKLKGTLFTYFNKAELERGQSFMFNYKGTTLHIDLDEDEKYYNVAPLHCKVIDKYGQDVYNKYKKYLSDVDEIKSKYIIVNDKVFDYFIYRFNNSPKLYTLRLKLEDGTEIEGRYDYMEIIDMDNKQEMFEILQNKAQNYYETKKIEPSKKYFLIEKTQEYQEKINWINELHESL